MLRRPAVFLCGRVRATKQCKIPAAARCRSDWAHPERDDQDLRAVFDDAGLWRSIQYPNSTKSSRKGLFGHASLSQPADLPALTTITILKANTLVRRICDLPSKFASEATGKEDALLETAIQFDRLSDLLCSVIDPSECIRNVFNQPDWKLEAEKAYAGLCEYMNVLNTHVGLYQVRTLNCHPVMPGSLWRTGHQSCP